VPAMAQDAAHVTMLQRSPTWIGVVPGEDELANKLRSVLPAGLAHHVIRTKNILFQQAVYAFCQKQPRLARKVLLGLVTKALRDPELVAEHFTPSYDPWDQRVCAVPDADLFRAIRKGRVDVVTDHIDTFVREGIRLRSGRTLEADVVVTATGLKLLAFGGIAPSVDGVPVDLREQFVWQGTMLTGLPNFAVCVGYTNASWTLRGDLSSRLVCRVLNEMARREAVSVVPVPDRPLEPRPLIDLAAGYVQRSIEEFPRQGHRGPWRVRQNYLVDSATTMRRDLSKSLRFERAKEGARV
jgi:monooxygenase